MELLYRKTVSQEERHCLIGLSNFAFEFEAGQRHGFGDGAFSGRADYGGRAFGKVDFHVFYPGKTAESFFYGAFAMFAGHAVDFVYAVHIVFYCVFMSFTADSGIYKKNYQQEAARAVEDTEAVGMARGMRTPGEGEP